MVVNGCIGNLVDVARLTLHLASHVAIDDNTHVLAHGCLSFGYGLILRKSLLTSFSTNGFNIANYEGMCLGPTLSDGSRCLVLIPDSQGGMSGLTSEYIRVVTFR